MRKRWTEAELRELDQLYPDKSNRDLASHFRCTESAIANQAVKRKLSKSSEYMSKNPGCFKRGITPWNKGIRWYSGGRSHETRFKEGQKPPTAKPVGSERVDKDGVLLRKYSDTGVKRNDWRPVHIVEWEKHNGQRLPKGHIVTFRDGDKRNFSQENLECISRAENMRRNTVHRMPKEVALAVQMLGALNRQINKRTEQ